MNMQPPQPRGYTPSAAPYEQAGGYAGVSQELAGFWRRLVALIIDSLLVGVVGGVIGTVISLPMGADTQTTQGIVSSINFILALLYFGILWSQRGQTVGYMALGMRLVRTDGGGIGILRAMARFLLIELSFSLCVIPAIISAFMVGTGQRKQAIHDLIVDTVVVQG